MSLRARLAASERIRLRAFVNEWISDALPKHRKYLKHSEPEFIKSRNLWRVGLNANGCGRCVGHVWAALDEGVVDAVAPSLVERKIDDLLHEKKNPKPLPREISGENYSFYLGDGISAAQKLQDNEIDLLLTDPPYGISKAYTCETQVPRRLRNNGRDFIMPKGHFGDWDAIPLSWLEVVLPKVGGWVVTFCAHAQIGEYQEVLTDHKFVAVGAMVWKKTNPVPFNHRFKPVNSWEAIVVGKRPRTKFNGHVVHNVFLYKSPSPRVRIHPTQKPLPLLEEFVGLFTDPGDLVFDPFGGAATTLIAASKHGRRAVSYELEPEIYQTAGRRILDAFA